jgi:hypothetical protein
MVIVSESGKTYPDGASIPLHDRVVLHRQSVRSFEQATRIADDLQTEIEAGDYPEGARVTIMDSSWQFG